MNTCSVLLHFMFRLFLLSCHVSMSHHNGYYVYTYVMMCLFTINVKVRRQNGILLCKTRCNPTFNHFRIHRFGHCLVSGLWCLVLPTEAIRALDQFVNKCNKYSNNKKWMSVPSLPIYLLLPEDPTIKVMDLFILPQALWAD